MNVVIEPASDTRARTAIAHMLQLYIHDFADFMPPERKGLLDDDGLYTGYPLEPYFTEPDREALLIRLDGRLAGFALLDRQTHTGAPLDHNMGEFFIARAHRRGGAGMAAARAIFAAYRGRWQVAVARLNAPALSFWRAATTGAPGLDGLREKDVQTALWNGPVLSFTSQGD